MSWRNNCRQVAEQELGMAWEDTKLAQGNIRLGWRRRSGLLAQAEARREAAEKILGGEA